MSKSNPKLDRVIELFEFEREVNKAEAEFAKKPVWMQAAETGDRMPDGSDEQEYT